MLALPLRRKSTWFSPKDFTLSLSDNKTKSHFLRALSPIFTSNWRNPALFCFCSTPHNVTPFPLRSFPHPLLGHLFTFPITAHYICNVESHITNSFPSKGRILEWLLLEIEGLISAPGWVEPPNSHFSDPRHPCASRVNPCTIPRRSSASQWVPGLEYPLSG